MEKPDDYLDSYIIDAMAELALLLKLNPWVKNPQHKWSQPESDFYDIRKLYLELRSEVPKKYSDEFLIRCACGEFDSY